MAWRPTTLVPLLALLAAPPRAAAQPAPIPSQPPLSTPAAGSAPAQQHPAQAAPVQEVAQQPTSAEPTAAGTAQTQEPPQAPVPTPAPSPAETANAPDAPPPTPADPPPPYEPPPPPLSSSSEDDDPLRIPDISVRIDPLNWVFEGHLGVELEVAAWKFISIELVPMFVVDSQPPTLDLGADFPEVLEQESNGLGALSAASLAVGFWLSGKPFEGTVLKAIYEHSGYTYRTEGVRIGDDGEEHPYTVDEVTHTGRRVFGFLGAQQRIPRDGIFTIAAGIGLGYELNPQRRCFVGGQPATDCRSDDLLILLDPDGRMADLNGPLHPACYFGRLSLGAVF